MTRGRKKDPTIAPTRALTAQREYRDRRAKYVADLEERCAAAEAEAARLRVELDEARRRVPATNLAPHEGTELMRACTELFGHMSSMSGALARFQDRLASVQQASDAQSQLPDPVPTPHSNLDILISAVLSQTQQSASTDVQMSPADTDALAPRAKPGEEVEEAELQSESEAECCGGFIDCTQLSSERLIL